MACIHMSRDVNGQPIPGTEFLENLPMTYAIEATQVAPWRTNADDDATMRRADSKVGVSRLRRLHLRALYGLETHTASSRRHHSNNAGSTMYAAAIWAMPGFLPLTVQ